MTRVRLSSADVQPELELAARQLIAARLRLIASTEGDPRVQRRLRAIAETFELGVAMESEQC